MILPSSPAFPYVKNTLVAGVFVGINSVMGITSLSLSHCIGRSDPSIDPKKGCLVLFLANLASLQLCSVFLKHGANDTQSTKEKRTFTVVAGCGLFVGALTALLFSTTIKSSRDQLGTGILLFTSLLSPIAMGAIGIMK